MLQSYAIFAIFLVFLGCCSNVVFLELIIKDCPGAGNIITFSQFAFISAEGFVNYFKCGRTKPAIPIKHYATMVMFFFLTSVVNNYALNFNIPVPLHMIFRAGSLIANMVLGIIILKREYNVSKYLSVFMITIGICMCTIASAQQMGKGPQLKSETGDPWYDFVMWLIGIGMLVFALFMSARMGIYQEELYTNFGKQPKEALFYSHTLPLPAFLFLASDIYKHCILFSQSELLFGFPKMWVYLLGNCITQYLCINGVFILTSECPSLIVTLVITLRKFISLLFSILYFRNPFTIYHWFGTCLVFLGTFLFVDVINKVQNLFSVPKQKVQ
ncbi:UDP-xylose and UDP-N-acetylglucosamine transporter-like [Glandiceps talaboti]